MCSEAMLAKREWVRAFIALTYAVASVELLPAPCFRFRLHAVVSHDAQVASLCCCKFAAA
jgi:hypothetical protein